MQAAMTSSASKPGSLLGGGALKPQELLPACINIIGTFEPTKTTVDSHHADFCKRHKIQDASDVQFLHQVAYGCQRYKKLLKVFLSSFYFKCAAEAARTDAPLYTVLAYLAILRLEELSFEAFRLLVRSQDLVKARVFLKFLFDEDNLTRWLKEGWLTLYEPHYVQTELIDQVLKFEPQVRELVSELERQLAIGETRKAADLEAASALAEGRGGSGRHTVPEPFNLTRPAPRLIPEPAELVAVTSDALGHSAARKARAWRRPDGPPRDQLELDKRKEANRVEMRRKYAEPSATRPALLAEKRPSTLEAARAAHEARLAAELTFRPEPPKPVPKWDADEGHVKLNAAAILREDQIYRRKQAAEADALKAYESDLADTKAYDAFRARARREDDAAAAALLERRRAETALADEAAKAATEATKADKRGLVLRMKLESEALADGVARADATELARRRGVVEAVGETRENGALAREEAERARRETAEAVREESKALDAERRRALGEEEERRAEVIRQIRALEQVPRRRERVLDLTYEAGHGLLNEMSLAELHERLALVRAREVQAVDAKRAEIVRGKHEGAAELAARLATIAAYRKMGAAQAEQARVRERAEKAEKAEADRRRREHATLALEAAREALRAKGRAQEAALAAELKAIKIQNSFLGASKDAIEAASFAGQTAGARREADVLQSAAKQSSLRAEEIQAKELALRDKLRAQRAREQAERAANQALRFANSAFDASLSTRQDEAKRLVDAAAERASKAVASAAYAEMYPYTDTVNTERRADAAAARTTLGSSDLHRRGGSSSAASLRLGNTLQGSSQTLLLGSTGGRLSPGPR